MNKFIVTTTIQYPTEATLKFANMDDWDLIVVGDKKTPHDAYKDIDCVYLSPADQEKINKPLSDAIGWNKIQRRNMGFLYAYMNGVDILATVDDDNIPYEHWGRNVYVGQEIEIDIWESKNGYFDPLSVTAFPNLWHRGYPLQHVPSKNDVMYLGKSKRTALVQADLWDGDPDIDAMCRLSFSPVVKYDNIVPFSSNQMSPFNSQNTFISRDVIPYYMVLPYVGRMDDIWGGYIIQKQYPNSVIYNNSTVYQDRNVQDLITNLENEIIGYRNTLNFINGEYTLPDKAQNAYDLYVGAFS